MDRFVEGFEKFVGRKSTLRKARPAPPGEGVEKDARFVESDNQTYRGIR
jgi:hypothetical protein